MEKKKTKEGTGISSPFWFWASERNPFKKKAVAPEHQFSGAEADASTLHPSVMRPDTFSEWKTKAAKRGAVKPKESQPSAHGKVYSLLPARFIEAEASEGGPHKFRVALIQEGLGNLRDGFYYTKEALASAVEAFEGRKCYADHPSRSEEQDRPERSVRDIVGHFRDVKLEEGDDGVAMLTAELVMLPGEAYDWARSLVTQAVEYSKSYQDKELIGLSINANGDATAMPMDQFIKESKIPKGALPKIQKAQADGLQQVRVVHTITDAVSTDLVTEPGARGKVLELIEGENMAKKKLESEAKKIEGEEKKDILPEAAPGGDEDHADVAQDKALIMDMIKKHMGEAGEGMEAESEGAAHEAYEAYKQMGYSEDEAMKCAAHAMKLAKHMAGKQAESKEKCEDEAEEKKEAEAEEKKEAEEAKPMEADIVKMTARIAFLERELKSRSLVEALDKKLKDSGLGRAETDKLRDLIGKPRSEAHIDETIKVFKEAFGLRGESKKLEGLFVMTEKATEAPKKSGISFADFLRK